MNVFVYFLISERRVKYMEMQTKETKAVPPIEAGKIQPPIPVSEHEMPEPPQNIRQWLAFVGPAAIIAAGGAVGGTELLVIPYLSSRGILNMFWLYPVATLLTVVLVRVIARWTIITGESSYQLLARFTPKYFWPILFIFLNILNWWWPSYVVNVGVMIGTVAGVPEAYPWIGAATAIVCAILLSVGIKWIYRAVSIFYQILCVVAFASAAIFIPMAVAPGSWGPVLHGWFASWGQLPIKELGLAGMAGFLTSIIIQPSGGTLNLNQSYYFREQGYGMGRYIGRMMGLRAKEEEVATVGLTFNYKDETQLHRYHGWMHGTTIINLLFLIGMSIITPFLYSLGGYGILRARGIEVSGLKIPVALADTFGEILGPVGYGIWMAVIIYMMFNTAFSFFDSNARMEADLIRSIPWGRRHSYRWWYYVWLIGQLLFTFATVRLTAPLPLFLLMTFFLVATMVIYIPMLLYAENKWLPIKLRPPLWETVLMIIWTLGLAVTTVLWVVTR